MSTGKIILGVLMFAVATSILYIIGLRKKATQDDRLYDMLLNNAAYRVVSYLKEHEKISDVEITLISKEVKAKEFLSEKVAVIRDGEAFYDKLVDYMLRNNYVKECGQSEGKTWFCLPDKEGK